MQVPAQQGFRKVTELSNRKLRLLDEFVRYGKIILRDDPQRGTDPFGEIGLQEGYHYRKEMVRVEGMVATWEWARLFTLLRAVSFEVQARRGFNRTRVVIEG